MREVDVTGLITALSQLVGEIPVTANIVRPRLELEEVHGKVLPVPHRGVIEELLELKDSLEQILNRGEWTHLKEAQEVADQEYYEMLEFVRTQEEESEAARAEAYYEGIAEDRYAAEGEEYAL